MIDPRLYLVLDPVHGAAHPGDLVRAAASGGITAMQVRSPTATTRALLAATLADLVAHVPVATVAIGGITAAWAAAVLATGVAGLAVSSAIVGAADPAEAARVLRRAVDRARGAPSGSARG